ncbi:hypothetical protein GY45DRAFT_877841 [Cubamyces sp. BRFM 1775]|nr:hypothetical protein GY45DRAFT_877841 [Cubamyces sp. BRFM 1775]
MHQRAAYAIGCAESNANRHRHTSIDRALPGACQRRQDCLSWTHRVGSYQWLVNLMHGSGCQVTMWPIQLLGHPHSRRALLSSCPIHFPAGCYGRRGGNKLTACKIRVLVPVPDPLCWNRFWGHRGIVAPTTSRSTDVPERWVWPKLGMRGVT